MYADKDITCKDCGTVFTFTAGEQERFSQLGFTNEPKRCATCRKARKAAGDPTGRSSAPRASQVEMHDVVCAGCQRPTQVPFKPRGTKPVYCRECFRVTRR